MHSISVLFYQVDQIPRFQPNRGRVIIRVNAYQSRVLRKFFVNKALYIMFRIVEDTERSNRARSQSQNGR